MVMITGFNVADLPLIKTCIYKLIKEYVLTQIADIRSKHFCEFWSVWLSQPLQQVPAKLTGLYLN